MRNSFLISSAVTAVAVAGSASAALVVDDFTQSIAPITTWDYAGNGRSVDGIGSSVDMSFGTTGTGHLGRRLVCTNTWPWSSPTTLASATVGGGQFATSLFGGSSSDNQMMAQYRFDSAVDLTQASLSTIRIAGSGTASGGSYGIGVILFKNLRTEFSTVGWDDDGNEIVVDPYLTVVYDGRYSVQMDMTSSQSFGDFNFAASDVASASDLASINGFAVFQYAYGDTTAPGTWNYTATSFSFVPAPGAAALAGLAGLITSRRRKA
jgi:hypothetical protein